jgi:hypothetical protein
MAGVSWIGTTGVSWAGGGTSRVGAVGWMIGDEVTITTVLSAGQLVISGPQLVTVILAVL